MVGMVGLRVALGKDVFHSWTLMREPRKPLLFRAGLFLGSLAATTLLLEILLRSVAVVAPQGSYGASRLSPELGLRVHAAAPLYHRVRWTHRAVNADGFLDVDHAVEKPPGLTRVGFFGDSYVEALQVPLEETFFRRLPPEISGQPIETFGFGISGWGTLHSLAAYRVFGRRYDLDYVVYVFVTNDPGDQHEISRSRGNTWATLADAPPGFVTHTVETSDTLLDRASAFAQRHLILARVIRVQWRNLWAKAAALGGSAPQAATFDQNSDPSTWPPDVLAEAKLLTRLVLAEFRDEVARDGRQFAVLYVPRGDKDLQGGIAPEDDWWPWLSTTCAELDIRILNPRDPLRRQSAAGVPMYDDHWSPAAHGLIASFLAGELGQQMRADERRRE
jgi:hypothetical protein